ncbi:MAG: trp operon repressor [Rickettsiales bacterium]|jgi:TrpR-related protein YerC/YecD|nr:trp operon repressor [Rickettsiales bacterium]
MLSLYEAFASIRNEKEFGNFLRDLCTPAEMKALNERWSIAQLLSGGSMSQKAVADRLGASVTTVTRVARFLNDEPYKGYRLVLSRLHRA